MRRPSTWTSLEAVGDDAEAATGDGEALRGGDCELVELDVGVKAGGEGVDDAGAEEGLSAVEDDADGDGEGDGEQQEGGAGPEEDALPAGAWLGGGMGLG